MNLKETIIEKLQDVNAILTNKVVKLEGKIKNLEIQNNNLNLYNR